MKPGIRISDGLVQAMAMLDPERAKKIETLVRMRFSEMDRQFKSHSHGDGDMRLAWRQILSMGNE